MMVQQRVLVVLFWVLPLSTQEDHRKPSPFPEKEQISTHSAAPREPRRQSQGLEPVARTARVAEATPSGSRGEACFFSKRFNGEQTASGELLNSQEMVAAHAILPLRSRVKVTNVANGKTIEVRVIDRMRMSRRIISVSEAAAKELGFLSAGTAEVRLEPLAN